MGAVSWINSQCEEAVPLRHLIEKWRGMINF